MNRQLTISGLVLAALVLGSVLLFTYMMVMAKPTHEVWQPSTPLQQTGRPVDPYNVPAQ